MVIYKKILLFSLLIILITTLYACETTYQYYRSGQSSEQTVEAQEVISDQTRQKIVENALKSENIKNFTTDKRKYSYDCSGFVFYVYDISGIDLFDYVDNFNYGGVTLLYLMGKNYFNVNIENALPGDIILFRNTYDKNKNALWDDDLTHAAIVTDYNSQTAVYTFAHIASTGWKLDYMSLSHPQKYMENGILYNSFLRKNDSGQGQTPYTYLAGNLFQYFVDIADHLKKK